MAAPTPTTEPASLIAGDTARWLRALPDYPASAGWVLSYTLANTAQRITFASTASGDDHLISVPAATTATWPAGAYEWRAQVTKGAEVYTVAAGSTIVRPSFGTAVDARSHARVMLAQIEAYLQNSNNLTAASYEIAGRKLARYTLPDLLAMRSRYQYEVAREDALHAATRGLPDKRRVMVRFGA